MAIGIILGIVFAALAVGAFIWCGDAAYNSNGVLAGITGVVGVLLVIAFILVPFSFHTVETGEVAVVKTLGEAKTVRTAGTHFDFWVTNSYVRYDTKVQNVDIVTSAYSSDAQTMDVAMTLQYQIIEGNVLDIVKEYGTLDVLQNRIQSIAIEKTKSVLSSYKAMDIIKDRASMSPIVEQEIKSAIGDKYFVNVSTIVLTNIDFSDAFEKAVEDKMIAEQNKIKAEYDNEAKINAAEADKQATIKAQEAQAEANKIAAQSKIEIAESNAKALLTEANAQAEALNIQTLQVARMLGLTEFVTKTDSNGQRVQATDKDNKLLYLDENGNYTTDATYIDKEGNTHNNLPVYVMIEQIKENLDVSEAQKIKDYIEYIKYLESWDGKLPDTLVGDGVQVILPTN